MTLQCSVQGKTLPRISVNSNSWVRANHGKVSPSTVSSLNHQYSSNSSSKTSAPWRIGLVTTAVAATLAASNTTDEEVQDDSSLSERIFDSVFSPFVQEAECCGIVGTIGIENPYEVMADGITILQNRGYDSAGIATIDSSGNITVTKVASVEGKGGKIDSESVDAIEAVKKCANQHVNATYGIAHTRWATHGGKTDVNAHPHLDFTNNIALVHNGTISNYRVLRDYLEGEKIIFKSETDTEVIVNLLGKFCDPTGSNFEEAFKRTISRLRGTWGLVCVHRARPDVMMVSRHGSPLLIGRPDNRKPGFIVASEQTAFNGLVENYVEMDENETLVLSITGTHKLLESKVMHKVSCDSIFLSPAPFKYWTEREIQEQPQSILRALGNSSRLASSSEVKLGGLDVATQRLLQINNLFLLGCGTSFHAGLFGATLFRKLKIFQSVKAEDASEFVTSEQISSDCDLESYGACILSQSGETLDIMRVVDQLKSASVTLFSVINVVGSAIARATNLGVYINAGREVAVASTKAFMCQVVILSLVGCWFHQNRGLDAATRSDIVQALCKLSSNVDLVLKASSAPVQIFTDLIVNNRSMFILGKGLAYPVALEGALKIKEISYLHAEGFGGGSLKHGPFALLSPEERTPVILLIFDDPDKEFMINAAEQVKARGSLLAIITDLDPAQVDHLSDHIWTVPSLGTLTPLLAVVPLQLLALQLSIARGYNPDKPRGLAKTVTVW